MSNATLSANSDAAKAFLPLITNKGVLRVSKPKDGNAAYIWRMVGFMISRDSKMQCMPISADWGVEVPGDWKIAAPESYLDEQVANTRTAHDVHFCQKESPDGTIRGYFVKNWTRYDRRKAYIKEVLDPIYNEIVDLVPPKELHGVKRWGRALGHL